MVLAAMALLFAVATAWMTRPLWRGAVDLGQRRRAANVVAYRQRLAELEADAAAGLIDADTLASLRGELDARLVRDAGEADAQAVAPRRQVLLTLGLALVVAGVALLGYVQDGSWRAQQQIASAPKDAAAQQASIEQLISALAQRMQQNPDDAQGWALLGRSLLALQRYTDAATAFSKANALTGSQEPDLLTNEGEARALAADRQLGGAPQALFEAALKLDPQHRKARWYAGLSAEQAGDLPAARRHWLALSQQELPEPLRAALDERLQAHGIDTDTDTAVSATGPGAATSGPVLRLAVSLAPELAKQLPSDATLFVFAKAAEGPPMPLAVHRGPATTLPLEVRLDDSMAMMPTAKLSNFDRWVVTARLSRTGGAQAVSGDLQGSLTVARQDLGDAAMALVIDQVVP